MPFGVSLFALFVYETGSCHSFVSSSFFRSEKSIIIISFSEKSGRHSMLNKYDDIDQPMLVLLLFIIFVFLVK